MGFPAVRCIHDALNRITQGYPIPFTLFIFMELSWVYIAYSDIRTQDSTAIYVIPTENLSIDLF